MWNYNLEGRPALSSHWCEYAGHYLFTGVNKLSIICTLVRISWARSVCTLVRIITSFWYCLLSWCSCYDTLFFLIKHCEHYEKKNPLLIISFYYWMKIQVIKLSIKSTPIYGLVESYLGVPWPFFFEWNISVILASLDNVLKNKLLCPSQIREESAKNRHLEWSPNLTFVTFWPLKG